ncbi:MAG: conjugal transfer protein TraG N-terminal domain-containing protein [Candidatus Thiodiazotropha endolucinida]|nr:conjugal transfer protein TraG N-terminal domain-containing protein [Candidatus Thiodiazotropha taylori]MCW4225198.1 conjugal transfer protein TraG N-terminal domain-containing protein [Candidatus Thiodiazotropha endolucinida]MCG7880750.1 conjugal transfer protein TraG N-terminal domain-containing protein [Candidatus Thiodiazotropha taylori]MCG7886769.1 conjugal transfer protein TraG N-terminal domain-containing protein [Candidatus Thiodiazotropha taylori]MCG8028157.1 conjugal transfer prote
MAFVIYSIGDSDFLEEVLIAVASVMQVSDYDDMIKIGMAVGVISVMLSSIVRGGNGIDIHHVIIGYFLWATLFIPTTNVKIEDTYTGNVSVVSNVPMGPALAGGIISYIGFKLTEMFEVAYAPIIPKITKTEFAESLHILSNLRNKSTSGSLWHGLNTDAGGGFIDLRRSWTLYIKDCTLKKIDLGLMSSEELVTEHYQDALRFNSKLFGTHLYVNPSLSQGEDYDCASAWKTLNNKTIMGGETVHALEAILGLNSNNLSQGVDAKSKIQTALDALLKSGVSSQTYMKVAILDPLLLQAAAGKYDQLHDVAGATMINQAIQQRNTSWASEQTLFMSIVRPMLAFFEAFIYAITPMMSFIILLGMKGIILAAKYFTMLIWIQLWMPILSIINLYIYTAATRKLDGYNMVNGHHWDSFYALNTAADVSQSWVATGGLLAASTPAISLMLVYGSSITATHLAGRLRSSDVTDEKYQTPDIKNNPAMASVAPTYRGDTVTGMMVSGAEGALGKATVSSVMSSAVQSNRQLQNTASEQFSKDIGHSLNQSSSAGEYFSKAAIVGEAVKSGQSSISQNSLSETKSFMDHHGIDQQHTEAIAGTKALAGSLSGALDVGKAASYLSGTFGVGMSAAKTFLNAAGGGKGKGNMIDVKARAKASLNNESKTTDATASTYGQKTASGSDYKYTDSETAQFNQEVSSQITQQDQTSFNNTWGESDSFNLRQSASDVISATTGYQTTSALQSSLGSTANMEMRTIGALVAGRTSVGGGGQPGAQELLDNVWRNQPAPVKQSALDAYDRYTAWGMPEDVAINTARLTAMTDSSNFMNNDSGYLASTLQAANVIRAATGMGTGDMDYDYNQNSNLSAPNTDINLDSLKKNTIGREDRLSAQTMSYHIDSEAMAQRHQDNIDHIMKSGREAESSMMTDNLETYRNNVVKPTDIGTAAMLFGSFDNASGWIDRRVEQIGGATSALLGQYGEGIAETYDAYKSASPAQADQLKEAIIANDDALFDNLGIAGLPIKGAQVVGNTIMGAAIEGVDAVRGWMNQGTDISPSADALSLQEKGAFFAGAFGEISQQGQEVVTKFMDQYGNDFKASMEDIGMQQYGLTAKQSAIFAESFDTDDQKMRQKVLDYQKDFAEKDREGNPLWNDSLNQWELSEENQTFTNAVVDKITQSTAAGDRVGAYLQSVSGYNIASQTVTPDKN